MKNFFSLYYRNLFFTSRFFTGMACSAVFFLLSFFFPWLGVLPELFFWALVLLFFVDVLLLYRTSKGVFAKRHAPDRLSNGDDNELGVYIENLYPFNISAGIIDEIPFQFQKRDVLFNTTLKSRQHKLINYFLRPTKRGEYEFGDIRVYVTSPIGLIRRRYNFGQAKLYRFTHPSCRCVSTSCWPYPTG